MHNWRICEGKGSRTRVNAPTFAPPSHVMIMRWTSSIAKPNPNPNRQGDELNSFISNLAQVLDAQP